MARAKHGLGQGLEALVTGAGAPNWANFAARPGPEPELDTAPAARWEYAQLRRARRKKKRLRIVFSNPDSLVRPREVRLPRISRWSALGLLGRERWELAGVEGRRYLFKRRVGSD